MNLFERNTYKLPFDYDSCNISKYPALRSKELIFSSQDLLHAVITCGMPHYYLQSTSSYHNRLSELLYKIHILNCALDEKEDPSDPTRKRLVLSDKLDYLDASERSVLSYYIGMFFTKLISEKIFQVPYLVHLGIAEMNRTIKFSSKERPDLIGYSLASNNYSVFEAKGRINLVHSTLDKAYRQTTSIRTISGSKPSLRVAHMTHFKNQVLYSYIKDPEESGEISLDFPPQAILRQYYQPFYELAQCAPAEFDRNRHSCSIRISMPDQHLLHIHFPEAVLSLCESNMEFILFREKEILGNDRLADDLIYIDFE